MKHFLPALAIAATVASAALTPQAASASDFREHRSMYITNYLSEWPTSAITASNAEQHKQILRKNLDKFKAQNLNVLYYHVRSNCDATYESAYEPWSAGVGGTRGVAPAFDPFRFFLDEAHARGIEVYAWVNPYRYCGKYTHGESPLDYELTHPEWLIVQENKETILNPALEEVKQRICDVISDIISKYDVDGIIFDDYFYSNPTPYELDAADYEAAKAANPNVGTQLEWRVNNINELIGRVYDLIKATKPYLVFAIAPAGVASPPNVTSEYGLEPAPDYDWQYAAIASDPLNWYKTHHVDFMAPQLYWPNKFDSLQDWWAIAARKFERHLYSAITLSAYNTYKGPEYAREVEYARASLPENESGLGFFSMNTYVNASIRIDGKLSTFGDYLGMTAQAIPTLTPLRPWNNVYAPANVTGLKREGNTLSWDAVEGMRYTIYAFDQGEELQPYNTNLVKVHYTNTYEIPEDLAGKTFGVAVYDRYGNEYSMSTEGASLGAANPAKLVYPANGTAAADLFDFVWEDTGCDNILEVSETPSFESLVAMVPTRKSSMTSYSVPNMVEGKTYYWRVRTVPVNAPATVSEVSSFVASRVAVTGPGTNTETVTPTVTWTPAYEGTTYKLEIGRNKQFTIIDYTAETSEASHTVEAGNLLSGFNYFVRVTAMRDGRSSVSDVATFATADIAHKAPGFINPATTGATLHSNETVEVANWGDGIANVVVQISTTDAFPARQIYKATLKDGATATPELSTIKVASKNLVDGQTYYVRTCANYYVQSTASKTQSSEYNVSSFVYSSEAGISDVVADSEAAYIEDATLHMPVEGNNVNVYAADGTLVLMHAAAGRSVDLSGLVPGMYIVSIQGPTPATLKFNR